MLKRRTIPVVTVVVLATIPAHPEVMGTVVLGMHVGNTTVINKKMTLTPVQLKLPNISIQHF
jgi:hypothetical protein